MGTARRNAVDGSRCRSGTTASGSESRYAPSRSRTATAAPAESRSRRRASTPPRYGEGRRRRVPCQRGEASRAAGLLVRQVRGHQSRIQAVRRRRRLPRSQVLEGTLPRRRSRAWLRRGHARVSATPPAGRARHHGSSAAIPDGQDDFPVGGISWFEAAAFAEFAGKSLPTLYHWYRARNIDEISSDILRLSNFEGKGPLELASAEASVRGARSTWPATSRNGAPTCGGDDAPLHPRRQLG